MNIPKKILTTLAPREALAAFFRAGLKSTGTPRERRIYKTLWARVKRLDPAVRQRDTDRMRTYRNTPEGKKAQLRASLNWRRKNRARFRRYMSRWHRENRRRHCHFCRRPARPGRHGLRRIVRAVAEGDRLVDRVVLWCGCS
jgi:hypothetical protein